MLVFSKRAAIEKKEHKNMDDNYDDDALVEIL